MSLSQYVKDATESLQQLPALISAVTSTPGGWLLVAIGVIWFLANKDLSRFLGLFNRRTRKRLEHIDQYFAKPDLADPEVSKVLRAVRDTHHFRGAIGIDAEAKRRTGLIALHERVSPSVPWEVIRRADKFIVVCTEGVPTIKDATWGDRFGYGYNIFMGLSLVAIGLAGMLKFLVLEPKDPSTTVTALVGGMGVILLGGFAGWLNRPAQAANLLRQALAARAADTREEAPEENVLIRERRRKALPNRARPCVPSRGRRLHNAVKNGSLTSESACGCGASSVPTRWIRNALTHGHSPTGGRKHRLRTMSVVMCDK